MKIFTILSIVILICSCGKFSENKTILNQADSLMTIALLHLSNVWKTCIIETK